MSNFNLAAQAKALSEQAEKLLTGKEYFLGDVVKRFQAAAEVHPHDQCIRNAERFLSSKMEKLGTLHFVSQADIQEIYDTIGGLGKREAFTEELGDLLLEDRRQSNISYNEDHCASIRDGGEMVQLVSGEAVDKLATLFSESPDAKVVRGTFIEKGKGGVAIELETMGYSNPIVEVAAHDDNFVIYAVAVESSKGRLAFAIPAEISRGSVLLPSTFVVGDEFRDLTKQNLDNWVSEWTSNSSVATPKAILSTLNKWIVKEANPVEDSGDFTDVVPKGPMFYMDHIGGSAEVQDELDVSPAKVAMPASLKEIGDSIIGETLVEAGLSFSRDTVIAAKNMIAAILKDAGIGHDRIAIGSEFPGGLVLTTNINFNGKKNIEVPVEVFGSMPLIPGSFTSGGYAGKFNTDGLVTFAKRNEPTAFNSLLSNSFDLSFPELHKLALLKTSQGNFIEATEALTIISDKFGDSYHKLAHDDMMALLRAGYAEPEKPLSAMEIYAERAAKAATARAEMIKVDSTARMFYPRG